MADFDASKTYLVYGASLKRLADIVREKIGQNVGMTLEQMGNYIYNLKTDGFVPPDGILISGDCNTLFGHNYANDMILNNGDRITTANLTDISYLFINCDTLESFPFTLNAIQELNASGIFYNCTVLQPTAENLAGIQGLIKDMDYGFYKCTGMEYVPPITFASDGEAHNYSYLFSNCYNLKEVGALTNMRANNVSGIFNNCYNLRHCPEFPNFNSNILNNLNIDKDLTSGIFNNCYSLRAIPENFLSKIYAAGATGLLSGFNNCWTLDEIKGINPLQKPSFSGSFKECSRVKDITFAVQEDGTPYKVEWAGLTLNLHGGISSAEYGIGFYYSQYHYIDANTIKHKACGYNSGITSDKEVKDDATYQALKNDPDWWTRNVMYSRYNHDSAVNTINSLPDASDYIAATGRSNNTIKFYQNMGGSTDGGRIGKLTAEEIAVAAAKGWTVAF